MQTVRTLSTQAAEGASAPSAGLFVTLESLPGRYLEVLLDGGSAAGSPTSVKLGFWRSTEGTIARVGTQTILLADVGAPEPPILDFHGEKVWVTVESFDGGSSPTLSGTIKVRTVDL